MHRRNRELKSLVDYAKSLGIKVRFKSPADAPPDTAAMWSELDNDTALIEMFIKHTDSRTRMILYLLHELAHHIAWRHNGSKDDPKLLKALAKDDPKPKRMRQLIYEMEKADSAYRLNIAKELNIKIPEWKILLDIELDDWIYFIYWQTGKVPKIKETSIKIKELKEKYAPKNNIR